MYKKRSRLKKNKSKNVIPVTVILVIMLAIVGIHSFGLWQTKSDLQMQKAELEAQIQSEEARKEELADLKRYVQTDSYAEEVAQDKLGLVHEGEIVFEIRR
ncbi:MAG: septum formation initiator family protein [Lachnospiraceae bacterium]|nr:septum formation initiator family protein [Lachnospiraceae bacterium]